MKLANKIINIFIIAVVLIIFFGGFVYAISSTNDIDSTSYNYKCNDCEKVVIEKEKISNLNCLNNKEVSNINIGYNVYDDGIKVSENYLKTNFIYMFINYKNSLGEIERLRAFQEIHDSNFFWEKGTVSKINFQHNTINLITSKQSLMMEKGYYLKIIEELVKKSCNNIQDVKNKIAFNNKKINNIKSWEKG